MTVSCALTETFTPYFGFPQLADVNGKDPCLNSLESAAGHSVKKTALENIDFKSTGNGEVKEDDSTANHEQMFEGSPLKSTEGKHDLETANTQVVLSCHDPSRCKNFHFLYFKFITS